MGHYDSSYEYDAEQERKERLKALKKLESTVSVLKRELQDCGKVDIPERFIDSLEDLRNWLVVHK